jgi:hypothetical protein
MADGDRQAGGDERVIRPGINFMMFEDKSNKLAQFRARTSQLDHMRDRNTAHVIPELARLLHELRH